MNGIWTVTTATLMLSRPARDDHRFEHNKTKRAGYEEAFQDIANQLDDAYNRLRRVFLPQELFHHPELDRLPFLHADGEAAL